VIFNLRPSNYLESLLPWCLPHREDVRYKRSSLGYQPKMSNSNMEGTRHTSAVCTAQGSLVLSLMHQTLSNQPLIRSNPATPLNKRFQFRNLDIETDFCPPANFFYTISKEPGQYLLTSFTRRENYNITASALIHETDSRTHLFADTRILEPFEQQVLTDSAKPQTAKPIRQDLILVQ